MFSIQTSEDYERIRKIKSKKIFLDSSPPCQPAQKGEGVRVENVGGIYSAGKYPYFATCVRTQIDFYLKGGITTHSDNKTRLNRLICVYNGRYGRKQDGTWRKMYIYTRIQAKSVYLCVKKC